MALWGAGFCPLHPRLNLSGTGYPCRCGTRRGQGACPLRHLLYLPRGRGPSQTPPSLATDSSISPGPPSPWLPALLVGNRLLPFSRRTVGTAPGDARGEAPCIKKPLSSPFPPGRGVGGMGAGNQTKGRVGGRQSRQAPPPGTTAAKTISAAGGLMPGMQGAKPLA